MTKLFLALGYGYVAAALARRLLKAGWRIVGATRGPPRAIEGGDFVSFDGERASEQLLHAAANADAALCSIPPDDAGCPAARALGSALRAPWRGYLSTTGVYGDLAGRWAFEWSAPNPQSPEARRRVLAEAQWRALEPAAHTFRLPGIYGPGRSAFDRLRAGDARRIVKPGQVFSRVHVEDIASALEASLRRPNPGRVYNVCDDEPTPPQDVIAHAAALLGVEPPPETAFEAAALSPMARRFYAENKRVSNARLKAELGWRPQYPDYRAGLEAIRALERDFG